MLSVDSYALAEKEKKSAKDHDSVGSAEQRVQVLTAKLEELTAARQDALSQGAGTAAETGPGGHGAEPARHRAELTQEVTETTARLEQARQWMTSARAALSASRLEVAEAEDKLASDFPDPAPRPDPARRRPA